MRSTTLATAIALALAVACGPSSLAREDSQSQNKDELRAVDASKVALQGAPASMAARAKAGYAASPAAEAANASPDRVVPGSAFSAEAVLPTMIIRSGNASVEVDSLDAGVARVRVLAQRVGGFVANTMLVAGKERPKSATLEIRLPSARFDDAITGLEPIGHLESVNVTAEDVGEEYVDVAARVANAHRLEQRLIEVLATKTGKLRDVLDVERELARVREEIERMEGRMRYLRSRSSISTLSITVHEPYPVVGERGSSNVIAAAFKQSWRNFVTFTARAIAALGTLIPTFLLFAVGALVIVKVWRRYGPKPKPE